MDIALKQFVPSEVCLKCDGCCRFPDEKSIWRPKVAQDESKPLAKDIALDGRLKTTCAHGEEQCVFFNHADRTCKIYQTRPFECRLYPFVLFKKGSETVVAAHLSCPYVQEKGDTKEAEGYVGYLRKYFEQPDIKAFLANNPALATDYSEFGREMKELFTIPDDLLSKKSEFERFAGLAPQQLSTFSFSSIYLWKDFFQFRFEIIDDCLCVFAGNEIGAFLYLPPIGKKFSLKAIEQSFKIMDEANGRHKGVSRIENVPEEMLKNFPQEYISSAKPDEYCYNRRDIAELKGNALKSKRSAYNQFSKKYAYEYRAFAPKDIQECSALYEIWAAHKLAKSSDPVFRQMIEDNRMVHRLAMESCRELGLIGRVVCLDQKVKAYTFGYRLNDEIFCILLEIADPEIKSLPTFIFSEFCSDTELEKFATINVMDDFALDNVRQTKLSFKPSQRISSYIVKKR